MLNTLLDEAGRRIHNAALNQLDKQIKRRKKPTTNTTAPGSGSAVTIGQTIPSARTGTPSEPVTLSFTTRLRHCFITGQTGSGKTTLARTLILDDLLRGNGLVNIDYRGESTDLILQYLAERFTPEQLKERLVLLDMRQKSAFGADDEPVVIFNPLREIGNDGYATTAFFLDVLRQVWGEGALGVQLIDDLRHVLLALTLSSSGTYTILDIERMLTDPVFRAGVLAGNSDPIVKRFFERFENIKDPEGRVLPVTNKLSPLTTTHLRLRATLGSQGTSYSFRKHFEEIKNPIVLVCLAADETAKSVAGVIGALFLSAAIKAVMRSDRAVGAEPKNGVHFLLDEAANYATAIEEPLDALIREGRKFGAFCTLVTQTPSSLSSSIRSLLMDVVGTMCFFSQGLSQAESIAGWISSDELPKTVARTLLSQAKPGEVLLLRQGHPHCRIKLDNPPYPTSDPERVRELRRSALLHWGTPTLVEALPEPEPEPPVASVEISDVPEKPRPRRKKA